MTTDGRSVGALAPEATRRGRASSRTACCSPRRPGATFYHRLRDKFGRLPTEGCRSLRTTTARSGSVPGRSVGARW